CPACGHVSADNRQTQARFLCVECGFEENADLVGAINILRAGHAHCACEVSGAAMPPAAGTHRLVLILLKAQAQQGCSAQPHDERHETAGVQRTESSETAPAKSAAHPAAAVAPQRWGCSSVLSSSTTMAQSASSRISSFRNAAWAGVQNGASLMARPSWMGAWLAMKASMSSGLDFRPSCSNRLARVWMDCSMGTSSEGYSHKHSPSEPGEAQIALREGVPPDQGDPAGNGQVGAEGDGRAGRGAPHPEHDHTENRTHQRGQQNGHRQDLPA